MINVNRNIVSNPDYVNFLKKFWEGRKKPKSLVTREIIHPAKREQGKSCCQREIVRRNKAQYGKRQIAIVLTDTQMVIHRDRHMPPAERKLPDAKPLAGLEAYRAALLTSGYRLLDANPHMLIYQYEGRLH